MRPPILLFAYARPVHTERTLSSLKANGAASEHDLIVYVDGPKSPQVADKVAKVVSVVSGFAAEGSFRSLSVIAAERNRGLARSVIHGVSEVLSRHEAVIVLEDDLLLAPDFLAFMDEALTEYAQDERIWSVSGFSPALPGLKQHTHDLYLSLRGSSWGWGTWRRSWNRVDWHVEDYAQFEYDLVRRRAFNRGGRDMAAMLDAQMDGRIDSWAIRWCYSQHKQGMYSVVPTISKVRNIGLDGSGTHGVVDHSSSRSLQATPVSFEPLSCDPTILREFARSQGRHNKFPPYSFLRHLIAKRGGARR